MQLLCVSVVCVACSAIVCDAVDEVAVATLMVLSVVCDVCALAFVLVCIGFVVVTEVVVCDAVAAWLVVLRVLPGSLCLFLGAEFFPRPLPLTEGNVFWEVFRARVLRLTGLNPSSSVSLLSELLLELLLELVLELLWVESAAL